jgi:hypothetical protein
MRSSDQALSNVGSTDPSDQGQVLLERVRAATARVFGDHPLGMEIDHRCREHEQRRRELLSRQGGDAVLAIVGAAGQGKSWLARQFVRDPKVQSQLPSGDAQHDATQFVTWIGPRAPISLDPRAERYVPAAAHALFELGCGYILVDTPGASDVEPQIAAAAARACETAAVQLLVIRRDQVRNRITTLVARQGEGGLVLPIINVVGREDNDLKHDVQAMLDRLHDVAPTSQILEPLFVEDFEHTQRESAVASQLMAQIGQRLRPVLASGGGQRGELLLSASDRRFRQVLAERLGSELPRVSRAVERLEEEAARLPSQVVAQLQTDLDIATTLVRGRLRTRLLADTSSLWFPYRTLLGLLNLTAGAWDRLILAMAGSLPSLLSTAWASTNNLRNLWSASSSGDRDSPARRRADLLVRDRLRPAATNFRRELASLQRSTTSIVQTGQSQAGEAYLEGLDELQATSERLADQEVARAALPIWCANLCGLLGTTLFWGLLSSPILALYRHYFAASREVWTATGAALEAFPEPSFRLLATSVLVSLLPVAVWSMLVMSWAQRRRKAAACAERIEQQQLQAAEQLQRDGVLRLAFDDPLLDDARLLLSLQRNRD